MLAELARAERFHLSLYFKLQYQERSQTFETGVSAEKSAAR